MTLRKPTIFVAVAVLAAVVPWFVSRGAASGQGATVHVFPIPGARFAAPQTQITLRGVPAGSVGTITVTGSKSGDHSGTVKGDSDGQGASFLPDHPFAAGETVTVKTGLDVAGGQSGTFSFSVANPAGGIPNVPLPPSPRVRGDVMRFRSRPDLVPPSVKILRSSSHTAPGDIFVGPQQGPVQNGAELLDSTGKLIWFQPVPPKMLVTDFRVQTFQGAPVLTWWQGRMGAGVGIGEGIIDDTSYRPVAVVHGANGLAADLHEFQLTPQGTALITAYYPVFADASSVHGSKHEIVLDSVVQEIDIPTGLVLFQWDSLDHVPLADSYSPPPPSAKAPYDYFHINAIQQDHDGQLLISARNTWTGYKIDHSSGSIIWRLGGKHSSFKMGPGTQFAFQHDIRSRANNDLFVTIFDDGALPPVHKQSRGLKLILDLRHMTARRVAQHEHVPPLLAGFEGNFQQLPDADDFVGWGQQPYFTEYDPHGNLIFDGRFVDQNANYRAYRFVWSALPLPSHPPRLAVQRSGSSMVVYASWNGATSIASWRVLGGASASSLTTIGQASKTNFETAIRISAQKFVAVQAIDAKGQVLGTSATSAVK